MSTLKESSSSSEDEDTLVALKEATDSQFLNEFLFHSKSKGCEVKEQKISLPKSLRPTATSVEESNEFGVTQDFKNFVAKELAKVLDKTIQNIHYENGSKLNWMKSEKASVGIKLTTDSKIKLNDIEINDEESFAHNERHKRELKNQDNHSERISKCRKVAVEPDWILSKVSTSVWTDKQKGKLYKYKKLDNGILTEIN